MSQAPHRSSIDSDMRQEPTLQDALCMAIKLHQENHFAAAEQIYRSVLYAAPAHPDVLHFFGVLRHQQGYMEEGAHLIEKALAIAPEYLDAHNNLGNIYLQTGQAEKAEAQYRKVITLAPRFVAAYANLGVALKKLERYDEAVDVLTIAIDMEPAAVEYYRNLGNVLRRRGDHEDAITFYRKALELKPYDAESYRNMSRSLYLMGAGDRAAEVLDQWLSFDPENPTAIHMRSAYTGEGIPPRASNEYVQETFDRFADSFDYVLKRLDYRAPSLVHDALTVFLQSEVDSLLDAGCGTGLCGALVRPLARRLVGVDLSPRMIDRARARGFYDELVEGELTECLERSAGEYDAIVCADTLCYFGELATVLCAAARALRPDGWFVFTLEKLAGTSAQGFRLNRHGRYSHSEGYLSAVARAAGLSIGRVETTVLRMELGEPVHGFVITCNIAPSDSL